MWVELFSGIRWFILLLIMKENIQITLELCERVQITLGDDRA